MAGTWTADRFPRFEAAIRRMARQHQELEDEPLHLAIAYHPSLRDQQHIYLFEVIGGEGINPERDLFEVAFESTPGFPMEPDEQLHLILTNPGEVEVALRESWTLASEIVDAMRSGRRLPGFACRRDRQCDPDQRPVCTRLKRTASWIPRATAATCTEEPP